MSDRHEKPCRGPSPQLILTSPAVSSGSAWLLICLLSNQMVSNSNNKRCSPTKVMHCTSMEFVSLHQLWTVLQGEGRSVAQPRGKGGITLTWTNRFLALWTLYSRQQARLPPCQQAHLAPCQGLGELRPKPVSPFHGQTIALATAQRSDKVLYCVQWHQSL